MSARERLVKIPRNWSNIDSVVTTGSLTPFLRYSTSNNGVPSKNGRVVSQHVVSVWLQRLSNAVNGSRTKISALLILKVLNIFDEIF